MASAGPAKVASDPTFPDPSERFVLAFRAVAPRMSGLGFVNPALEVEAVGFAPWEGCWLGMMVTPWFMNLTLVALDPAAWRPLAVGAKRRYRFPAGDYEFVGAFDAALGEHQVCSVFSPMQDFADHPTARMVAELALAALFDPANAEVPARPLANLSPERPLAQLRSGLAAPLSKREFLHGRFHGDDRGDRG